MKVILTSINSTEKAQEITEYLLKAKAAACVQLIKNVTSSYWWRGNIETETEIVMLIKTNGKNLKRAMNIIKNNHPYEVPEIVSCNLEILEKTYRQWLHAELE